MIKQLFVFRHGETDWNREGRFQGHIDISLNETGRQQARALIPRLQTAPVQAILSSDLSRAQETARIIAEQLGVSVHCHPGLREAHLGEAQGLTVNEIVARLGQETLNRWKSYELTDADVSYPGGETGQQVMDRVFSTLENFLDQTEYQYLGVSTHGGVIRRMMQRLLPPGSDPVPIPNTVLYAVEFDIKSRQWRVKG